MATKKKKIEQAQLSLFSVPQQQPQRHQEDDEVFTLIADLAPIVAELQEEKEDIAPQPVVDDQPQPTAIDCSRVFITVWNEQFSNWTKALHSNPTPQEIAHAETKTVSGWNKPYLLESDLMTLRRWDWWLDQLMRSEIDYTLPIPQVSFIRDVEGSASHKMLTMLVDRISTGSRHYAISYLIEWLAYGFGLSEDMPNARNVVDGANAILYKSFLLPLLLAEPYDHLGHLLIEIGHGQKSNAFYPTPMHITELMTMITMQGAKPWHSAYDPCVGTGRTLLSASNMCLHLAGQDIDSMVIMCTKINMMLYAPWGIAPHPNKRHQDEYEAKSA